MSDSSSPVTHPSDDIRGSRSDELANRHIVLGITGSIAAVETVKLARELIRHGAHVTPVMTREAQKIVHPYSLEFAAGSFPITELTGAVQHVALCGDREGRADLLLVAPATANTISKMACGIDDTPVTTCATTAIGSCMPVLVVPAMHGAMYDHPVLEENIGKLQGLGTVHVMDPRMEERKAKMPGTDAIVLEVMRTIYRHDDENAWRDRNVLVISGATEEPVDDMRTFTNRSSGATGMELGRRAYIMGARTELWTGRSEVPVPVAGDLRVRRFDTTGSLLELVDLTDMSDYDVIINCAAISDYRPKRQPGKILSGNDDLVLGFDTNPKIIDTIAERIRGTDTILVGFKAESGVDEEELVRRARSRMADAGMDMIVANDLRQVERFESTAILLAAQGESRRVQGPRSDIARVLFEMLREQVGTHDP